MSRKLIGGGDRAIHTASESIEVWTRGFDRVELFLTVLTGSVSVAAYWEDTTQVDLNLFYSAPNVTTFVTEAFGHGADIGLPDKFMFIFSVGVAQYRYLINIVSYGGS
jgi:hypothetical protein